MTTEYLKTARLIIALDLPRKTNTINEAQWLKAQEIVGKMLGASNETYVHPTLLYGLCERIAEGLQYNFDLGWKAAGGEVFKDQKRPGVRR